jgi:hypothetical protein
MGETPDGGHETSDGGHETSDGGHISDINLTF